MKTYNEMAEEVFRIGDERKSAAQSNMKKTAAVITVVFAAALAVTVWQSGLLNRNKPEPTKTAETAQTTTAGIQTPTTQEQKADEFAITTNPYIKKNLQDKTTVPDEPDGGTSADDPEPSYGGNDGSGGVSGGAFIPLFPQKDGIKYTGEKLTDEEAAQYFKLNGGSISSALSSSGVAADRIKIKEKGYCHAMYSGVENEQLEVRQNFRDYLVYNGDELVSIVTLWKENGTIYSSPAFGAKWFYDYNKFLNSHKGEELVYVYAGQTEFIVTPDGEIENPLGYGNTDDYFGGITNLYERLYCPETVYVP